MHLFSGFDMFWPIPKFRQCQFLSSGTITPLDQATFAPWPWDRREHVGFLGLRVPWWNLHPRSWDITAITRGDISPLLSLEPDFPEDKKQRLWDTSRYFFYTVSLPNLGWVFHDWGQLGPSWGRFNIREVGLRYHKTIHVWQGSRVQVPVSVYLKIDIFIYK